jgi:hypothetical protein
MYYRLNQDWLDPLIAKEMQEYELKAANGEEEKDVGEGGKEGEHGEEEDEEEESSISKDNKAKAKSRGWNLQMRSDVIRRHFDQASEDDLRVVAEALIQEQEKLRLEADIARSGRALARSPKLRNE